MFLQPVVENAVIHGLYPKEGDKNLDISFSIDDDFLKVDIEDNGIGREASYALNAQKNKRHVSLATTIMKDRIQLSNLINKNSIQLEIIDLKKDNIPTGTKVVLTLPIIFES